MTSTGKTNCSVRLCKNQAPEISPITCLAVCEKHLRSDLLEIEKEEALVAERTAYFKQYAVPLRLLQQRLTCDLQCLEDNFEELHEMLCRCRKELFSVISMQNDQLLESLSIIADISDFELELQAAKQECNSREVYRLNKNMWRSLETQELDSKLVCMDQETKQVKVVSYPDVNSKIMEIRTSVEQQLVMSQTLVELVEVKSAPESQIRLVKKTHEVEVDGVPQCITLCTKTSGFVVDPSGYITSAKNVSDGNQLPQIGVFAAFAMPIDYRRDSTIDSTEEASRIASQIRLISQDLKVHAKLNCSWNSILPIVDIHCDSERQLLYIAQKPGVSIANLAGESRSLISVSNLLETVVEVICVTGSSDKLWILAKLSDKRAVAFALSKDSMELQKQLPIPEACEFQWEFSTRMRLQSSMLLFSNNQSIITICTITGLRIPTAVGESPERFQRVPLSSTRFGEYLVLKEGKLIAERYEFINS